MLSRFLSAFSWRSSHMDRSHSFTGSFYYCCLLCYLFMHHRSMMGSPVAFQASRQETARQEVSMGIEYALLGKRIRKARLKIGMTQKTLSAITDLSPAYYSHIERRKAKISLPTLVSIAQGLDTNIDSLLYDSTHCSAIPMTRTSRTCLRTAHVMRRISCSSTSSR